MVFCARRDYEVVAKTRCGRLWDDDYFIYVILYFTIEKLTRHDGVIIYLFN